MGLVTNFLARLVSIIRSANQPAYRPDSQVQSLPPAFDQLTRWLEGMRPRDRF
jgi:hypothetical protein